MTGLRMFWLLLYQSNLSRDLSIQLPGSTSSSFFFFFVFTILLPCVLSVLLSFCLVLIFCSKELDLLMAKMFIEFHQMEPVHLVPDIKQLGFPCSLEYQWRSHPYATGNFFFFLNCFVIISLVLYFNHFFTFLFPLLISLIFDS